MIIDTVTLTVYQVKSVRYLHIVCPIKKKIPIARPKAYVIPPSAKFLPEIQHVFENFFYPHVTLISVFCVIIAYTINELAFSLKPINRWSKKSHFRLLTSLIVIEFSRQVVGGVRQKYKHNSLSYLDSNPRLTRTTRKGRSRSWPNDRCRYPGTLLDSQSASVCLVSNLVNRPAPWIRNRLLIRNQSFPGRSLLILCQPS